MGQISDIAAPRIQIIFPEFNFSLFFCLLFLHSVWFLCFNVGFSHRQALLPCAYHQLQDYLLAKHLPLKETNFKFKQKSQDCFYLVYLKVYAHLLANHIDLGIVSGDWPSMNYMTTYGGQSFHFLLYNHLV